MASISTTSSASPAAQFGWQQAKLQQAKRNADQAEATARSLLGQARDAQRVADRAQDNARDIGRQADRAQATAGQARQGLAMIQSAGRMETQISRVADRVVDRDAGSSVAAASSGKTATAAQASPVVNTQGQVTGKVIDTTA